MRPERAAPRERVGISRHFEGWQAGLLAVVIAASAVVLAVPRSIEPMELPEPIIDVRAMREIEQRDDELAMVAEGEPLDVDVRMVGTELRQYNVAAAERREVELTEARRRLLAATAKALVSHERELLALRAYQMRAFLAELRTWQSTGVEGAELVELGGDFVATVRRNGWCEGADRSLVLDERLLRVVFKKRWNDVTGADAGAFALSPEEDRVRYGFFLVHPWAERDEAVPTTPFEHLRWQAHRNKKRLDIIDRIARVDPSYPADLGRGVLYYRLHQLAPAADAFRRQLEAHPDGPYVLRTQNHLKATLEMMRGPQH